MTNEARTYVAMNPATNATPAGGHKDSFDSGPLVLHQALTAATGYGHTVRCGCGWRSLHDTHIAAVVSGQRHVLEEFMVVWGHWYGEGKRTAGMIGIRADESLHRLGTIVRWDRKPMWKGRRFTTGLGRNLYNVYPIYDWRTEDIWRFHARFPDLPHNTIYDLMHKAGVPLSKQRLCQPYGDDQRQGLWLFHLLEPETWTLIVARVNGANTGALYVQERGNVAGYGKVTLPTGHTWKSYTNLLLASLPKQTREHFIRRFQSFIRGWEGRGYTEIPDQAPDVLESKQWAPSWRRMAKCMLRNDYWCKSLGQAQPKSEAWQTFKVIRAARKEREAAGQPSDRAVEVMQDTIAFDDADVSS